MHIQRQDDGRFHFKVPDAKSREPQGVARGIKGYTGLIGRILNLFGSKFFKIENEAGKAIYLNRASTIHWLKAAGAITSGIIPQEVQKCNNKAIKVILNQLDRSFSDVKSDSPVDVAPAKNDALPVPQKKEAVVPKPPKEPMLPKEDALPVPTKAEPEPPKKEAVPQKKEAVMPEPPKEPVLPKKEPEPQKKEAVVPEPPKEPVLPVNALAGASELPPQLQEAPIEPSGISDLTPDHQKDFASLPYAQGTPPDKKLHIDCGEETVGRFKDIHLTLANQVTGTDGTLFHANHVQFDGIQTKYIAAQTPVDKVRAGKFLEALREKNCHHLVWLVPPDEVQNTGLNIYPLEKGKTIPGYRCIETSTDESSGRVKIVVQSDDKQHTLTIHQIKAWGDHRAPDVDLLCKFRESVEQDIGDSQGTLAVSCRAGIGRTGTYIAIDAAVKGQKKPHEIKPLVAALREQRYGAIQSQDQYKSVFQAVDMIKNRPVSNQPQSLKDILLSKQKKINEKSAQNALIGTPIGTYIIRLSKEEGFITLTVKINDTFDLNSNYMNARIKITAEGKVQFDGKIYENENDLLDTIKTKLKLESLAPYQGLI